MPRKSGTGPQSVLLPREAYDVSLFIDYDEPLWLEHSGFDRLRVDVVALKIDGAHIDDEFHVNSHNFLDLMHLIGNDVFVVGYPFRTYTGAMIPIWKRGSFATEPLLPIDDKPMFLVDAATRPGMSGSPIFRHELGPAATADGVIHGGNIVTTQFIGIYAGHLGSIAEQINIGFGWYGSLVDDILMTAARGTRR